MAFESERQSQLLEAFLLNVAFTSKQSWPQASLKSLQAALLGHGVDIGDPSQDESIH